MAEAQSLGGREQGRGELTHVLFDFFGTLVRYSPSWTEQGYPRAHAILKRAGSRLSYEAFIVQWDAIFSDLEARAEASLEEYSMDQVCETFLAEILPAPPSIELRGEFCDTYLAEWNKGVQYIPEVGPLLRDLAQRFTLALVTNTHSAGFVRAHLEQLEVAQYFTSVVTSVEHGRRKPSPCIFLEALRQSSGVPRSALYVGDSFVADYQGAARAELRCLLIDPEQRHAIAPCDRLHHIRELAPLSRA